MDERNMEENFKREAGRQYLHYFRFWFISIGALAVICAALFLWKGTGKSVPRGNNQAPAERVYDYAEVLTGQEEEDLRQYIAGKEKELGIDIVLVTISRPVEGDEALEQGLASGDWNRNMQALADDFWDESGYGYNKSFEGDGILLLSNWYEGQKGEMFSTSGRVEWALSSSDIDRLMDAVYVYIDRDPYRAYKAYVDGIESMLDDSLGASMSFFSWWVVLILPAVAAVFYAVSGLSQKKAGSTVGVNAYVAGGKPVLNDKTDDFLRKNVVTRRIATDSGGSGRSSGGGGGGGHHRSSSGASHGGGGRRR